METEKVIRERKSRRSFEENAVEKEKIKQILDAARLAPSGINLQPWHYIVVQEREHRKALIAAEPPFNNWMKSAPLLIVACVKKTNAYSLIDLGLSIENLLLRATDLGLGSTPTVTHNKDKLRKLLKISEDYSPEITIALGYAKEKKSLTEKVMKAVIKGKKNLSEIISWEEFGKKE